MAGVIAVPVGARDVPAGTRTFLLEQDGRYGTYAYFAEVLPYWERTGDCWSNIQVLKITVRGGILADIEVLELQSRASKHEGHPRLRVRLPRVGGPGGAGPPARRKAAPKVEREYVHRIAAYAFPPQGDTPRARFGTWADFVRAGYQGDHLVDAELLARPNLAIAGWVDPVLPRQHAARERLRRQLREARDRAEEVRRRLARGPVRLSQLSDEIHGLETQARSSRKRKSAIRELRLETKHMKHALAESRDVQRRAIEAAPFLTWDPGKPEGDAEDAEYEQSLCVEFDRAHHWRDGGRDPQRVSLFALCRKFDLAKLRVPLSESGRSPVPEHPAGHGRQLVAEFLDKRGAPR